MLAVRDGWVVSRPGVLALAGSDFSVVYEPREDGWDFQIMQGERHRSRHMELRTAQIVAECKLQELIALGVDDGE